MPRISLLPNRRQVVAPYADLYDPLDDRRESLETQLLYGETVTLIRTGGQWCLVRADLDGYTGYVRERALSRPRVRVWIATYRVRVPQALVYERASFKSITTMVLAMNSRVRITEFQETPEGRMGQIDGLGWIFMDCVAPASLPAVDFVAEMVRFAGPSGKPGARYGWGARYLQVDCSSLVQHGLTACGMPCPRNVGQQVAALCEALDIGGNVLQLRRGDLVFWTAQKGRHVAVMVDSTRCVHATIAPPYRGAVIQTLSSVMHDQQRDGNGMPTMFRRIPDYAFR